MSLDPQTLIPRRTMITALSRLDVYLILSFSYPDIIEFLHRETVNKNGCYSIMSE